MDNAVVTGLYALVGAVIGGLISFIKDILTTRTQIKLERIRIHDKQWLEAHKVLYAFAQRLSDRTFPLAEDKRNDFIELMKGEYSKNVSKEEIYFNQKLTEMLKLLKDRYKCMTDPDLIPEINREEERYFFEHELFNIALQVEEESKKAVKIIMQ